MKPKFHYSFVICLAGLLSLFVCTGMTCNGLSVFLPFILKQYGISNTQISTMLLVRSISSFIAVSFAKQYYKVFSLRLGMFTAALISVASSLCYAFSTSYIGLIIGAVLAGFGFALGATLAVSMLINRWFRTYRNLAMAFCAMGTTLAVIGFPNLFTSIIEAKGLTSAFLIQAGIMLAVSVLNFLLIRSNPEDMGLEAFSLEEKKSDRKNTKTSGEHCSPLDKIDWYILIPMLLLLGGVANPCFNHLTVFMSGEGFSPTAIAIAVSFSGIAGCAGKLLFGVLSDKISVYFCNYLYGFLTTVGLLMLCVLRSDAALYIGNAMFVAGVGIAVVGPAAWGGDLSSGAGFDATVQRFQQMYTLGSILFNLFPGISADLCGGSYLPAYWIFTVFSAIIFIAIQFVYVRKGINHLFKK